MSGRVTLKALFIRCNGIGRDLEDVCREAKRHASRMGLGDEHDIKVLDSSWSARCSGYMVIVQSSGLARENRFVAGVNRERGYLGDHLE